MFMVCFDSHWRIVTFAVTFVRDVKIAFCLVTLNTLKKL